MDEDLEIEEEAMEDHKEEKAAKTNMRDSLSGFLRKHRVEGWDGSKAEPLPRGIYESAKKLVDALPEGNFMLGRRDSDEKCLVWAEIHQAAHEDTPVFRFYVKPEMFGKSHFSITVMRDGRYGFAFEESGIDTYGTTNSEVHAVKLLVDHLSDLGDVMLEE